MLCGMHAQGGISGTSGETNNLQYDIIQQTNDSDNITGIWVRAKCLNTPASDDSPLTHLSSLLIFISPRCFLNLSVSLTSVFP